MGLHEALNALTVGIALVLLLYAIAWLLGERLPKSWKIGDITLPPVKWLVLVAILVALGELGTAADDYVDLLQKRALIPPRDTTRFSVAVPDFSGDRGAEIADIIARKLQSTFGDR